MYDMRLCQYKDIHIFGIDTDKLSRKFGDKYPTKKVPFEFLYK